MVDDCVYLLNIVLSTKQTQMLACPQKDTRIYILKAEKSCHQIIKDVSSFFQEFRPVLEAEG